MLTKYIVERDMASAPGPASEDAKSVIARVRRPFAGVGTGIIWVESFRTGDKMYSVYLATGESLVHDYTRASGDGAYRLIRVLATVHPGSAAA